MRTSNPTGRLEKVFEKYRHKYEPYSLFERFLEYVIIGFDQTFSPIERPFEKEESIACKELFNEWVLTMEEELRHRKWYDLLGEIYMNYLSGTMKKKWTGQFFTPIHICDFMAEICGPGENSGERVMDNACGSGRMLLAAHALHLGNYCCAQDLDRICCLMTVCNFIIHGVNGEVIWGDGLIPLDYKGGWRTNELLGVIGTPCVRKMDKMESISYRYGLTMNEKNNESENQMALPVVEHSVPKKAIITDKKEQKNLQLSLFDDL